MAKNEIVWGIDIGNTSLKALRCRMGSEPGKVEVLGFDYIEHSKVLSQPGADSAEIMAETLQLFLSRNNIKGEKIAIAVSGQSALWRFQPLPPVDPKKVKDLVKYEVKQWLPFDMNEVIWNYRQVGGIQEGSILLDANIFMYAMKKELTLKTLASYAKNGIDVDCLQGAPVALYNSYVNDFYNPEDLEGKDPSELTEFDIILNVGTDTTEVVITNGVSVWLRNIPIGGNLFTKSLTKSLKLTFSNAEHIKRNAATSQDPKAVILAMKPVFNEMLSEVDRSIKYYCSLNKRAKMRKIYALGNAMKLPGLRQFLAKSHGIDVVVPTRFNKLEGPEVLSNPQFTENISSFAVAYGLALNLLHTATLDVNLIPPEVKRDRLINSKKPWALAAAALLMLAMTIQYVGATVAYKAVDNDAYTSAYNKAKAVNDQSKKINSAVTQEVNGFQAMDVIGKNLTSNVEGRLTWLELIKTLDTLFPADSLPPEVFNKPTREKAAAIMRQNRVYVDNIEVYQCADLSSWFQAVQQWYSIDDIEAEWFKEDATVTPEEGFAFTPAEPKVTSTGKGKKAGTSSKMKSTAKATAKKNPMAPKTGKAGASSKTAGKTSGKTAGKTAGKAGKGGKAGASTVAKLTEGFVESADERLDLIPPPTGEGHIVQMRCYHYHNPDDINEPNRGPEYVRREFLPRIKHGSIELPISLERQRVEGVKTETWTLKEFGINYPVMIDPGPIDNNYRLLDPEAATEEYRKIRESSIKRGGNGAMAGGRSGGMGTSGPGMGMSGPGMGMSGPSGPGPSGPGPSGPGMGMSGGSMPDLNSIANNLSKSGEEKILNLRRFDFVIQFVWVETPPTLRESRRKAAEEAKAAEEKQSGGKNGKKAGAAASKTAESADAAAADTETAPNPAAENTPAASDENAAPTPAAENPAAQNPANPAAETPVETPVGDTSAAEPPAAETPAAESPAPNPAESAVPAAETPASEPAAPEEPAAENSESETPASDGAASGGEENH